MKKIFICIILTLTLLTSIPLFAQNTGFTQEDRERLVKVETALQVFMEQVDKRFEQIDKRFEQIDKRFEQIDKRFEQVDKRFEQIDKRFDDVNKRFEDLISFLWMIVGIFTTLTASVIGFAYWDRRTIIKKAKEETIADIEKYGRVRDLIHALQELALEEPKVARILRNYNLF
ncbi:hypothetical protein JCM13304A_05520 [Desulfothermus okinawensis JCM 13304]